uniref:Putative lipocalin-7 1 n=1 Tax=Amblyomma triste TaxID=251400 RepID=A0A023GB30_AMBTT
MAISGVVIVWMLAKMAASEKELPTDKVDAQTAQMLNGLLKRIDPWKVVNSSQMVYLAKASWENSVFSNNYCVRSKYLWYDAENKTTYRTLEVSAKDTSATNTRSLNMSLQVEGGKELHDPEEVVVRFLHTVHNLLPNKNANDCVDLGQYAFTVMYADNRCLILENPVTKTKEYSSCTMWVTEKKQTRPPLCCDFIFFLLCRGSKDTKLTTFDNTKCPDSNTDSNASGQS